MTIAYIKNADGTGAVVSNTFRDTAGTLHTLLSDDYIDDIGTPYVVFRDNLVLMPLDGSLQKFITTDHRKFIA